MGRSGRVALFLSGRSLLRSNWGILVTTVGILTLIYLELVFLPSLIQGATNHVVERLKDTLTANIAITPANKNATAISDVDQYTAKVADQQGVAAVTATRPVGSRIFSAQSGGSWPVHAIDPASYNHVFITHDSLIEGHWLTSSDTDGIVLGLDIAGDGKTSLPDYATSLQSVHVGDAVTVVLSNGEAHAFKVVGIFDTQFRDADMKAYVTNAAADQLLPRQADTADAVYVKTTPSADPETVASRIKPFSPNLRVLDSSQLQGTIHDQTAGFKLISNILGLVSALVAAITIFIVTYIDLVNRRKQIGIERAIGIRGGAILSSYCLKALAYAVVGIALGLLLFKGAVVPFVASHPFHFPNGPVTLAPSGPELRRDALMLLVVAVVGAFLPAWRSMQIKILDAIWG
jgi:putative ABC transport system permease protein